MLYLVKIIFLLIILTTTCFAQNRFVGRKVSFFNKDTEGLKEEECRGCYEADINIINTPKQRKSFDNFVYTKPDAERTSIKLFIDTRCKYTRNALKDIGVLASKAPDWNYEVFVIGTSEEFKGFVFNNMDFVKSEIAITHDILNKLSKRNDIKICPTYIIEHKGKTYKIAGQPDLLEVVGNL